MKKELSSIDVHYMAKELQSIVSAKLDKAFQPAKKEIILQLHLSGKGKLLLRISPSFIHIAKQKPEMPEKVMGFCQALRKHLENARIRSVEQIGSERIVRIEFEAKDAKLFLFAELFGGGNIVLCDEKLKIIHAAENKRLKEREIRGGVKYKEPGRGIDIKELTKSRLKEIIAKSSKGNISTILAVDLGLGGIYSKELCMLSGLKGDEENIGDETIGKIHAYIQKILNKKINPQIVYKEKEIADITPFELKSYAGLKMKKTESLSSAVDLLPKEEKKKASKLDREIKGLEKTISKQEARIKELEKASSEMQKKGEKVYENYQLAKEILDEIKKARKKYSWKEIKEKLKGHKVVKSVNEKEGKVIVDF